MRGNAAVAATGRGRSATAVSCGSLTSSTGAGRNGRIFTCKAAPSGQPPGAPAFSPVFCRHSVAFSRLFAGNARRGGEVPATLARGIAVIDLIFTKRGRLAAGAHYGCSYCLTAKKRKSNSAYENIFINLIQ